MTVYQPTIPLEASGTCRLRAFFGNLCGRLDPGTGRGCQYFPILARRIGLTRGLSVVVIAILFVLFALVGGIFTILIHLAGPILLIWLIYTFIKNIWK